MLFGPSIHLMAEWFKVKKSLAYGFMCVLCTYIDSPVPPLTLL